MLSLETELKSHQETLQKTVAECGPTIARLIEAFVACFRAGHNVLLCGNGGSAADAQHVAGEFVNRFRFDRDPLPAFALTTDTSVLTCIGNDSSFDAVFSRQVEALGCPGDILVGISTSGKSPNVLRAVAAAKSRGLTTIAFTGQNGQETMGPTCDLCLAIPSTDTPRIQEAHEFVWHVICGEVEREMFGQAVRAMTR
jgi:D-sedoheptulose 7-phosphate isomerase